MYIIWLQFESGREGYFKAMVGDKVELTEYRCFAIEYPSVSAARSRIDWLEDHYYIGYWEICDD